jgi:hypothetical protein
VTNYYILLADRELAAGSPIPNVDADGNPNAAWLNPRNVEVTEALNGRGNDCLVDMVRDGDNSPVYLAQVTPNGDVQPHTEFYDPGDAEVDDRTPLGADGGWTVVTFAPLATLLGPQGDLIITAVQEGIRVLDEEEGGVVAEAYVAASNAQHDNPGTTALHAAAYAAEQALSEAGADGYWWANAIGCTWGNEILALAARDLIGATPQWTQAAYDLLTLPWRTAISHPLHSGDAPLAVES